MCPARDGVMSGWYTPTHITVQHVMGSCTADPRPLISWWGHSYKIIIQCSNFGRREGSLFCNLISLAEMSATLATSSRRQSIPRSEWPSISEFYRDKDIFITGATGYVGKCLMETILRSLPSKGRVFILMRPKRGKSVQERIAEIVDKKVGVRFVSHRVLLVTMLVRGGPARALMRKISVQFLSSRNLLSFWAKLFLTYCHFIFSLYLCLTLPVSLACSLSSYFLFSFRLFLQLYSVVRAENPDAFNRIVAVSGDISFPKLGISDEDEKMLSENVSIVFHLAASIQFNSSLRFEQDHFL